MLSGGSIHFQPAREAIDPLIDDLGSAHISIAHFARTHNTTVEALSAGMTSPDIAERLAQTDNAITWRTRLVASRNLPSAVAAITQILEDFNRVPLASARDTSPNSAPDATSPSTPSALHTFRSSG